MTLHSMSNSQSIIVIPLACSWSETFSRVALIGHIIGLQPQNVPVTIGSANVIQMIHLDQTVHSPNIQGLGLFVQVQGAVVQLSATELHPRGHGGGPQKGQNDEPHVDEVII